MKKRKPRPIDCVIREAARDYAMRAGLGDQENNLKELGNVEPLRKLLALGLSDQDVEDTDVREPVIKSLQECEDLVSDTPETSQDTLDAVNRTLKVISAQIQNVDLEIQMLNLRKKALKRRSGILERLAESLAGFIDDRRAA